MWRRVGLLGGRGGEELLQKCVLGFNLSDTGDCLLKLLVEKSKCLGLYHSQP